MASVQTSSYQGRYLKLTVVEESTSIANNTSTVRWTLESIGGSHNYYTIYNCSVVVNGTEVYDSGTTSWDTQRFPASKGSTSGTITVTHNNDGTASPINFTLHGKVYSSGDENKSGTLSLSTIPRAPIYNSVSASNITETSVQLSASIDTRNLTVTNSGWDLSTDGGSTWVFYSGDATSKTINNLEPNTKYWYRGYCATEGGGTNTNWETFTTYDYPKPASINNFVIGNGATVNLYNPLGRNVTLQLISNNDNSVIGTYSGTSQGDINSNFKTQDAINRQYASIPNSNSGTYYAKVTYGNIVKTLGTGTYSTNVSECSPSFSNFNVKDSNNNTVAITGNNQLFIKGYSNLYVTIPSANKMTTQKSATPSSYALSCDVLNKTANYSTSDVNVSMGAVTNSGTLRVTVKAYDSRNNSATAYKDITVYDYAKPVINASISRLNNFENETTLKISGTYTRLTINNTDKNTIQNVKYRYKEDGGSTWSNWANVTTSIVSGRFTCNDIILSLDNTKSFIFEIQVTDNVDNNTLTSSVNVGQSIFFISTNTRQCYINGDQVATLKAVYPVGAVYISTVSTNPNTLFGFGTWEQIQGKFLIGANSTYTAGSTGGSANHYHTQGNTGASSGNTGASSGNTGSTVLEQKHLPARTMVCTKVTMSNSCWTQTTSCNNSYSFHCLDDSGEERGQGHTHTLNNHTHSLNNHTHTNPNTSTESNIPPYLAVYMWKRTA